MTTGTAINQGRSKKDPLERYYTPRPIALAHVRWVCSKLPGVCDLWDPCAGDGAYLWAADMEGLGAFGSDIAPARYDIVEADALQRVMPLNADFDDAPIVTNPPFSLLPELLPLWRKAGRMVSLLLPISALERTRARRRIWDEDPPLFAAHIGRVKFTGPTLGDKQSGAAMAYVWLLWVGPGGPGGCTVWEWVDPVDLLGVQE